MMRREEIFDTLAVCVDQFVRITQRELYNDLTAEQQVAIHELHAALVRTREMCRAVALAFADEQRSAPCLNCGHRRELHREDGCHYSHPHHGDCGSNGGKPPYGNGNTTQCLKFVEPPP
jgi:hypothetical protein